MNWIYRSIRRLTEDHQVNSNRKRHKSDSTSQCKIKCDVCGGWARRYSGCVPIIRLIGCMITTEYCNHVWKSVEGEEWHSVALQVPPLYKWPVLCYKYATKSRILNHWSATSMNINDCCCCQHQAREKEMNEKTTFLLIVAVANGRDLGKRFLPFVICQNALQEH